MKPYYEHAGITIYHGDCREILPQLRDESVELLLTDPPYGVKWLSGFRQEQFSMIVGDHSKEAAEIGVSLALPILKDGRHGYVFGRYNFASLPICSCVELIWDKANLSGGDLELPWAQQHEPIQFFVKRKSESHRENGRGNLAARMRKGTVLRIPCVSKSGNTEHPTEKPLRLLRELIESSSSMDEIVLDAFAGVGTTLQAAQLEGRRAIGIEIEEKYCEIAAKRLSQEVLNFQ